MRKCFEYSGLHPRAPPLMTNAPTRAADTLLRDRWRIKMRAVVTDPLLSKNEKRKGIRHRDTARSAKSTVATPASAATGTPGITLPEFAARPSMTPHSTSATNACAAE